MILQDNGIVYMKKSLVTRQTFHWHDQLELLFVMEGCLELKIGYEDLVLNEGDMMLINSDEIHSMKGREENAIVISTFIDCNTVYEKHPDFYEIIAIWPYAEAFQKIKDQRDIILKNLIKLESALGMSNNAEELDQVLGSLLKSLIYCYRLDITDPDGSTAFQANDEKKNVIYRIIKYLYSNYNHKLNLQDISEQEYLSMFYLSHSFKDITGYSFRDWLNFVRAERAEKMLLETTLSITDIAYECGFSDVRYLNKHFIKWYNISPSKYRNLFKESFMQHENVEEYEENISLETFMNRFQRAKVENSGEVSEEKEICVRSDARPTGDTLSPSWKNELWCNGMSLTGYREIKQIEDIQKGIGFTAITVDELFGLVNGKEDSSLTESEIHVILNFLLDSFEKIYLIVNCRLDDFFEIETAESVLHSFFNYYPKGRGAQLEFKLNLLDGNEQTLGKIGEFINTLDNLNIKYKRYSQYTRPTDKTGGYEKGYLRNMIEGDLRVDWLFSRTGFKNNLYYFYYMLAHMGQRILVQEDSFVITNKEDDIQLFIHNEGTRFKAIRDIQYKIRIEGLSGEYLISNYIWDMKKNSIESSVKNRKALLHLTNKEREVIEQASLPNVTIDYIDQNNIYDGAYEYEVFLPSTTMFLSIVKKIEITES